MKRGIKNISLFILFIIIILAGLYIYNGINKHKAIAYLQEKDLDIVYGSNEAPLTIFMFTSYECTFCRSFFLESFPLLKKEYIETKKVKFVIKLVDITKNPNVLNSLKLAVCINNCGDFEPIDKLLLNEPSVVYSKEFIQLKEDFIAKNEFIAEYMLSGKAENYILSNFSDFKKLSLTGTPTFIINNKIYKGYRDYSSMKKNIEKELKSVL